MTTNHLLRFRWHGSWDRLFSQGLPKKLQRVLTHWLASQRWFLDKEKPIRQIELKDSFSVIIQNHFIWWLILQSNSSRLYQLPLALLSEAASGVIAQIEGHQSGYLVDAWHWHPFAQAMLQFIAGQGPAPHTPLKAWKLASIETDHPALLLNREHSNTAIQFDERYFLKAFRSITPGPQPEEEMGRELTRRVFPHVTHMLGGFALNCSSEPISLAVLSNYAKTLGSGWDWLLAKLQQPDEENKKIILDAIKQLGTRTAELHLTLAQPCNNDAFTPLPFDHHSYEALQQRVLHRLKRTQSHLRQQRFAHPHRKKQIDEFLELARKYHSDGAGLSSYTSWLMHRIHGDYHLGQVLRTDNDWLIIDFEGEPLRPLSERRAKDLPWRDVAGMLRSFSYLTLTAIKNAEVQSLRELTDVTIAIPSTFLFGYQIAMEKKYSQAEISLAVREMLPLYELEKALYEIEYELNTRPDWLNIPLVSAVQLLRAVKSDAFAGSSNVN